MTLKQLIKKLDEKPEQNAEVEYLVINADDGTIITCELKGSATADIMRVLAKYGRKRKAKP